MECPGRTCILQFLLPLRPIIEASELAIERPDSYANCLVMSTNSSLKPITVYLMHSTADYYFVTRSGKAFWAVLRSEVYAIAPAMDKCNEKSTRKE